VTAHRPGRDRQGAAALLALCLAGCAPTPPLPVLGQVPPLHLTSQTGEPFERNALNGHVWVADFIFTSCPGPCPRMSSQMRDIQSATADTPDVKLVSFTVDPAHDTPAVLAAYGKHFLAQPGRWYFLTGTQNRLNQIGRAGFKLNRSMAAWTTAHASSWSTARRAFVATTPLPMTASPAGCCATCANWSARSRDRAIALDQRSAQRNSRDPSDLGLQSDPAQAYRHAPPGYVQRIVTVHTL